MSRIHTLIFAVIILTQSIYAQNSKFYFGWDLTYTSVLEKSNVGRNEWIWKWLKTDYQGYNPNYQSPAKKWISEWQDEPIISSILIEFPAFHAAERTTVWLLRTKDQAYYWELVEDNKAKVEKQVLKLQVYDDIFKEMSGWQQNKPPKPEETHPESLPGYIGFISFYEKGKSRQMLLTLEDFVICETKSCDKRQLGRLFRALNPILLE